MKRLISLLLPVLLTPVHAAENVVLITLDGLRWQEVYRGLDRELATHEEYSTRSDELMERFWRETARERAETLLPFLHNTVFQRGIHFGNRDAGSCARIDNPWYFSYPGYSEILTGVINENIDSNRKFPNPERTVHELLESRPEYAGKTGAFGSWDVFPYIYNVERSGVHVNAFSPLDAPADDHERLLNTLHEDIPTPWPTVRNDAFTHHYAMSWFLREQPRLLHIAYGETDDFAHDGQYDEYIFAAHRTDRFIREVWEMVQSTEGYRDNTVLLLATDHGRGEQPLETWRHHASKRSLSHYMQSLAHYEDGIVGSEAVWIAAIGPGIRNRGLVTTGDDCISNSQLAATVLELMGETPRDFNPDMAPPLEELLP